MSIFTKILRHILWLAIIPVLLIWSGSAFSEEKELQNYKQEQAITSTIHSEDHEQEVLLSPAKLILNARLTRNGENITKGLVWRIYAPILGIDNKLPLIATFEGGSAHFDLEAGSYLVHVSFGHASMVDQVNLKNGQEFVKNFNLNAGGIIFNSTLLNGTVNEKELYFTIYKDAEENDDTGVILSNVKPQSIVRLKTGHYHVVSHYGSVNAITRSDIQVDAGKIIEVTFQHQAAQIVLKLVRQEGGEALADTSWSITNESGDIVYEAVGAYVSFVLAEGDYIAIAKNKDQIYQKVFSVVSGRDEDINVIANTQNIQKFDETIN
ncbi:carboxypeptidase regulatory-like domain-containing protein [Bartonella sp. WD16.2]|uniref:carboxypeptidase regulatory-like domain-containing protein n=1 Tax=Bartonella sp. WD16.2 TaxID=1933904 RepID=UPI0009C30D4F|nr:carboxypeptidase regulatory-like domain-containing protein [Bartonella sp. WD16.2]AQX19874.1 hypothetical protein BWD162_007570 [Bartonella sp. WD16.2]